MNVPLTKTIWYAFAVAVLEKWKADKTAEFPEGSYWVVVHHGAQVAA